MVELSSFFSFVFLGVRWVGRRWQGQNWPGGWQAEVKGVGGGCVFLFLGGFWW
ncbi:uncharacterized protein M6B38_385860 [Iris pallida]|uniref:Uncharacterized protein n=1 Tax=Iris pallida TaxID=29817 RepID=A0AAX6G2U0_IRIPA|nr:uncharacterized protein M6B38_385860 [Iris pallida]